MNFRLKKNHGVKSGKSSGENKKKRSPNKKINFNIDIFGKTLDYAASFTSFSDGPLIPKIIIDCIDYINENGIDSEGIYRISGSSIKVEKLKKIYNNSNFQTVSFLDENASVDDAASLLKSYLRELKEPIISREVLADLEECTNSLLVTDQESFKAKCLSSLFKMPNANILTLAYFTTHLKNVINNSPINKMTSENIMIVFSPTLSMGPKILLGLIQSSQLLFSNLQNIKTIAQMEQERSLYLQKELYSEYVSNELAAKLATTGMISSIGNISLQVMESDIITQILSGIQLFVSNLQNPGGSFYRQKSKTIREKDFHAKNELKRFRNLLSNQDPSTNSNANPPNSQRFVSVYVNKSDSYLSKSIPKDFTLKNFILKKDGPDKSKNNIVPLPTDAVIFDDTHV